MIQPETISQMVPKTAIAKNMEHIAFQDRGSPFEAISAQPASTAIATKKPKSAGGTLKEPKV